MRWKEFRFPLTITSMVLAGLLVGAQTIWHINIIELPLAWFTRFEHSEIDEIITLFICCAIAFLFEQRVNERRERARVEEARAKSVNDTMMNVQEIVGDFVTQVKILRADAKKHGKLEALMFDQAVNGTLTRLAAIGGLRNHVEAQMKRDAQFDV